MVGQLYNSRSSGTKLFRKNDVEFGWKSIIDIYYHDIDNAKQNRSLSVPGLKKDFIVRDSWTRLNVTPSKIMQQQNMINALKIHKSNDKSAVMVSEYLSALNLIFERGILSDSFIRGMDSETLKNINDGQKFFTDWKAEILKNNKSYKFADAKQKSFLAWQTFDLQLIMVCGFNLFCKDFFKSMVLNLL